MKLYKNEKMKHSLFIIEVDTSLELTFSIKYSIWKLLCHFVIIIRTRLNKDVIDYNHDFI